jgi:hypothetical protein
VRLGGDVPVSRGGSSTHQRAAGHGINPHLVQCLQIDHQPVVDGAGPGHAVTAAADRDLQPVAPGEPDREPDVAGVAAPGDHRRLPVDGAVPHPPGLVELRSSRAEHLPGHDYLQRG